MYGYMIFHLNLCFSSIEECARGEVIDRCYSPLLDICEKTNTPIGIEFTGQTLELINDLRPDWLTRFKKLAAVGLCELIGSGQSQIIGPLVPWLLNDWNQKLGIETYLQLLEIIPKIVLTNEMSFSNSLVDLYSDHHYSAIVMDRRSLMLSLNENLIDYNKQHIELEGSNGRRLPVLWSDSIIFQKMQQFVHGAITFEDYKQTILAYGQRAGNIIPIYTNDAEVFNYRPGRFSEETLLHPEGEWNRVEKLLQNIKHIMGIQVVLPSVALSELIQHKKLTRKITTSKHPISVKKQAKYNISRWAVTGKDDTWLNTECFSIFESLANTAVGDKKIWRDLCELWASDLRTHITEKRWANALQKLESLKNKVSVKNKPITDFKADSIYSLEELASTEKIGNFSIRLDSEEVYLDVSAPGLFLRLNLRRGACIARLKFHEHRGADCIGTKPHGYFDCISLGADYYSGGIIIELPSERKRITDLQDVKPILQLGKHGNLRIISDIETEKGLIKKTITINERNPEIMLSYTFPNWEPVFGSVRVGNLTFLDQLSGAETKVSCKNGGRSKEKFSIDSTTRHDCSASTLVTATSGFGATDGIIDVSNSDIGIRVKWKPSEGYALPLLNYQKSGEESLLRLFFSLMELDDTKKSGSQLQDFSFVISPLSECSLFAPQ